MSLDDALGDGNAALKDSLLRQYQQGDPKFATDAGILTERLARKLTPIEASPPAPTVDFSPPVAPQAQPEKAPDLAKFGTPVEPAPEPSTDDLSKFGTPVAGLAPAPAPATPSPLGVEGNLVAGGKGLLRGAPEAVGGIVQGIATARPTQPIAPEGTALIDQLANADQMSASERAKLMGQVIRTIGDRGKQMDFNAALQRIARGGDAQAEADKLRASFSAQNAEAAGPITEQAKYKTGTAIKDAIDQAVPMSDQEKDSTLGKLGTMASGVAPYAAATLVGGPAIGMAAGFTGMAADTYGQVYNDAKQKGAPDDVATDAARKSALVAGVLGSLPLGAGKYAQSLIAKVASSSAAFATAGEAQEAILQQIAKDYDPKAGYTLDQKRLIAELILGAGMGGLHHGFDDRQQPQQPQLDAAGPQPTAGAIPPGGTGPQPNADAGPQASASARANTPPPGPDTGTAGTAGPAPPGPDTGAPGAGNASDQSQQRQQPPPGAGEAPGADYTMAPGVRAKMERVYRTFTQGADPSGMSDGKLFNAVNEHLRDTSKTGYTAKPETEAEAGARTEAATARTERDGLIRKGWDPAWVDAMSPQQRRQKYQEAMAGGTEQPKAPSEHAPSKPQAEPRARGTTDSDLPSGKRDAPIVASTAELKASEVVREDHTPPQAAAGNTQLEHIEIPHLGHEGKHGITIETGAGQSRGESAEVTAAHHEAIEDVLGPMAEKVQPVDIARAAELLAEHPDMPPGFAFQHAVIENAVNQGDLTVAAAEEAYGPEVKEILGSGSEGAHSSEPRADEGRTEPREERARTGSQARVVPGSSQTGEDAEDTGAGAREDDQEPDTGRADADAERETAGSAEPETAAGEGGTASREVITERGAHNKPRLGIPGAETTGDGAMAQRAAKANRSDVAKSADRFQSARGIVKTSESAPPMSPLERAAIEAAVRAMMKRMLGDHAKIEFNDGLMQLGKKSRERWGKLSDGAQAAGMYYPYRHLIRLALSKGIDYTAFHEAYHASEYQLQTPQERALMNRETPAIRNWIAEKRGYSKEEAAGLAPEEVRAIGAEEYMRERVDGTRNPGEGVHVGIRRWWNKLWEALRALANHLRSLGFRTFKDIYGDLYEGKHADRAGDTPRKEADNRAPETFEEDLQKVETGREMVLGSFGDPTKVIKTFKNFWTSTFQPELVSDRALLADPLFARYKSSQAQEKDALVRQSESEWNYWNKKSDAQRIHFLDDLETAVFGRVPADPREAAMAKRYRAMLDENWRLEKQYGSQAAFVEDYFPHIWERPDDWRGFAEARSAQVGPTWFQKKRTIDYITDGLAAGLKLKYTNPVDIVVHRLSSGVDMRQRMELLHQLKDQGLAWDGVQGGDMLVRRGWRLINAPDRKQWVIAPDAQPLWKNAVDAKGLWQAEHLGGSIFRGWMALKNAWVPVKLAMSAFHPLHVLHINYSNGLAQGWDQLVKGRDPMAALKSVAGGFVGPLVAAPGATTGAVAGALLGSTVGMPVWGGIAGSMAGAATFGALKRAGLAHDLPHRGKTGKAAWGKRPSQQTPEEKAIVALMNDGGFVPQLSEQMKIGAQRSLAVAFQKALRKEATAGDWKRIVTAGMRRGIEKLQGPIFEQWIPALKTAAYLNQAAALLKRRPELLTYHNDRRVALRAIAKSIDNRFGEMFYGNLFWNRYLKDASIASFLSLGWNAGFVREFGGAVAESVTRPAGLLPPFKPSDSRRDIREATNKIPFAIAYMASSALILGMMSMLLDDDHKPPEGLDWIFPRVGGTNPDGSPRRLTNMSYIRELPMLMKHIQERGGNALTGTAEMIWNKLMFEPFNELINNRDYYGYNIWDENAPIYKQVWQGMRHMWGDQSPMTLAGAKHAAELSGKEFPSVTEAVTHPNKLLDALRAKGVDLSMLGFGPAPAYVEKSSIQNRIGYLYQQHVAPGSRPHSDEENSEEKMAVRTAIMIAKRDHDPELMQAARERGRAIGLTPTYMAEIGKTPTDVYLFSRLPADDQKSILARATPEEKERYFKHASGKVKAELNRAIAK